MEKKWKSVKKFFCISTADAGEVAAVQPVHNAGHVQQYEQEVPRRMQL